MLARIAAVLGVIGVIVVWGYLDATSTHQVENTYITLRTVDAPWLAFDTQAIMQPYTADQLFLELHWAQPGAERVASIQASGKLLDGDKVIADFNSPCMRNHGAWLANTDEFVSPVTGAPILMCYVKLDARVPQDGTPLTSDLPSIGVRLERLRQLQLKDFALTVQAAKPPLRYVIWINEWVSQIKAWISYPFDRPA